MAHNCHRPVRARRSFFVPNEVVFTVDTIVHSPRSAKRAVALGVQRDGATDLAWSSYTDESIVLCIEHDQRLLCVRA